MSSTRVVPVSFYTGSKIIKNFLNINSHALSRYTATSTNVRNIWQRANKTSQEEPKNVEPESETSATKNTKDTENPIKLEVEQLNKTIAELKEQNENLNDKYKRALADGENLRIRLTKQIEDAKIFGIQGFCKDLLEVADILGKATECVPKDEISDNNPHLKNLYEGLTMTETQLKKVFIRHGLEPINPLDEKFNPNLHEALFQQEVEGKDSGTVVVVSKIGYKLHDRVIRPALVGVSK